MMPEKAKTYRVYCLSTAMSPITHNRGSEGNETIVNREPVMFGEDVVWIPTISGNALRHSMVREPSARWLVKRYDMQGKINTEALQFLFSGGALYKKKNSENLNRLKQFWELFPAYRVLGGSLPDVLVPGCLIAWRGVPVCEEARPIIRDMFPDGIVPDDKFPRANSLIGAYQYTRHDPNKKLGHISSDMPETTNQMIYGGQTIIAGATFVHGFVLQDVLRRELGAFLTALSVWRAAGGVIGGMSSRGHGRLSTVIHVSPEIDQTEVMGEYIEHADRVKDEAIDWLAKEYDFSNLWERGLFE